MPSAPSKTKVKKQIAKQVARDPENSYPIRSIKIEVYFLQCP